MKVDYSELYSALKTWLQTKSPKSTEQITASIKSFFQEKYQNYKVFPNGGSGEYLVDVMVTNFNPLNVIESNRSSMSVPPPSLNAFIALESELGGTGGSSAYRVHKNVVEDYIKLLLIRAKYKVMVFTSLPFVGEENHLSNRVEILREIYIKAGGHEQGLLLVHLVGTQPKSTQVQASVEEITGFYVSSNGEHVVRIAT